MPADIILDGDDLEAVESGRCVLLGAVLYNIAEETLQYLVSASVPTAEATAILRKFMSRAKVKPATGGPQT